MIPLFKALEQDNPIYYEKKSEQRCERIDWEGQEQSTWGDAGVMYKSASHRCVHLPKFIQGIT